jgi:hypothetical protein
MQLQSGYLSAAETDGVQKFTIKVNRFDLIGLNEE